MLIRKGTLCKTLCCKHTYRAGFDFEPTVAPLVCNGVVYVRGPCFGCLFKKKIAPKLAKHGIITTETGE